MCLKLFSDINTKMTCHWIRRHYVYVAVYTVQIGAFLMGASISWISPILFKFENLEDNPLGRRISSLEEGVLGSIAVIGGISGCFLSSYLAKKYGRKRTLIWMSVPMVISYAMCLVGKTIWLFYLARILGGLTGGGTSTVMPMYAGEVAETKNRGRLCGSMNIFLYLGLLFSLALGPYTSTFLFNTVLLICPLIYMALLAYLVPESPYYLVEKNEVERAKASLRKLRGRELVEDEITQISENLRKLTVGKKRNFKGFRKGLFVTSVLVIFQQCSGIAVIMTYGQLIFAEVKDFLPSDVSPIIIGVMQVVFGFVAPAITDKSGRKILLILSYIGTSLTMFAFGIYFYLKSHDLDVDAIKWLPLVSLIAFKFSYTLGAGPVPWILVGEIFPTDMKERASSIVSMVLFFTTFLLNLSFNEWKKVFGMGETFWIYSGIGVGALLFSIFFVFETGGKSLKEIQDEIC